nr:reverse transcriptase domain-containing protein [Tanacetum cinerariifolium]
MRTRRSYFPPANMIPRHSKKQITNVVEPEIRTIVEMADNHTMAQMLQAPIEGYEDAIVVPQINANNFELKQTLINLVQSNQFTGRQYPHNHLRFFNKVTSTFRHPEVPNTTIKLLLFPFSLEGEARIWLDKEPPRSILTWKYLDALDSAAGENFLDEIPRECLSIIETKSKVRYSRSRVTDVRANTNAPIPSSSPSNSFDLQQIVASLEDKLDIRMKRFEKLLNDMKNSFITPTAPLKAVEECMRTRRSYFPPTSTIPRRSRKQTTNVVEPEFRTIVEMADNHTMAQMLQEPIEGYEDAIVKPNETFNEAWERFKDLLRQCPHYGFSELHQLDTFYNALNSDDQDALDSAAGGNFLDKIPRECLSIIESK